MRIGIIVPGFSADEADWCIPAVTDLVRELDHRHELRVIALRYPHRRGSHTIGRVPVHTLGGSLASGPARVGLYARAWRTILAMHARHRLHVLHALWADEPGFLAVTAGRVLRLPTVVSLMGGELARLPEVGYGGQLDRAGRLLTGHALRSASAVTAGSAWLAAAAREHVRGTILSEVPMGVDTSRFHPDDAGDGTVLAGGEIRLLHVASLIPVKDQETLLRAFALATRTPVPAGDTSPGSSGPSTDGGHEAAAHLHIVGDGPLRARLAELARELAISGHVTFHGAVPHDRLPAYYRAADFCVLTSRHESQGMVALEAAACGTPTVGTAVGILPELVAAPHLAPPRDVQSLATILTRLLNDPRSIARLAATARERVLGRFTTAHAAAALDALYTEVAGMPDASGPG